MRSSTRSRRSAYARSTCRRRRRASGTPSRRRGARTANFSREDLVGEPIDDKAIDVLFRDARTQNGWLPTPVTDDQIRAIYDILKVGPTSANSSPARFVFLRTPEAKARLLPALSAGNTEKTKQAPVTAIIGYDTRFHEWMPT